MNPINSFMNKILRCCLLCTPPARTGRTSEKVRAHALAEQHSLLLLSFRPQTRKDNKRARRTRLAHHTLIGISKFVPNYVQNYETFFHSEQLKYYSRWQSKFFLLAMATASICVNVFRGVITEFFW
jgi:hypothetical protein